MPFDLEAKIRIDYSEVDRLESEIEARTSGAAGTTDVKVAPKLDKGDLDPVLRDLKREFEARVPGIFEPLGKAVDLSPARLEVRKLTSEFQSEWQKAVEAFNSGACADFETALEGLRTRADEVWAALQGKGAGGAAQPGTPTMPKAGGGFFSQPMVIAGMFTMGLAAAGAVTASTTGAAMSKARMANTMDQVFGEAVEVFKKQAEDLTDYSGYAASSLMQVQVSLNKVGQATGLTNEQLMAMTKLSADMAASSGLPQYADNLTATTNALVDGLRNGGSALADFGINLDDSYVQTLRVNAAYAKNWENLSEAEKAQARYNAIIEQSRGIAEDAAEANEGASGSWRKLTERLNEAKESVGRVLLPVVDALGAFAEKLPPELFQAAIWAGLGVAIGAAVIAVVNGIRQVIAALIKLAAQAQLTASNLWGAGGKGAKAPTTTPTSGPKAATPQPTTPAEGTIPGYKYVPKGYEYTPESAPSQSSSLWGSALGRFAGGGAGTVAGAGGVAAAGFFMLDAYAINEARREVDNYWATVEYAHKQEALHAKMTGFGNFPEDTYANPYIARSAKWTGSGFEYYNYAGEKLGAAAQAWQEAFRKEEPQRWGQQDIRVIIVDGTSGGVVVTDAQSYAESAH
ncbi:MAG: hypothetical protein JW990_20910 [Thermoleophilia bacterium]|nr:hypothetical protein [Thermoleophilia bacterium]